MPHEVDLERYRPHGSIDLRADRARVVAQQVCITVSVALAVALPLVVDLGLDSAWSPWATAAVTVFACIVYMALHEGTHGVLLRLLTGVRTTYAVRLPFLTAGSRAYLSKQQFLTVAMAPVAVWGVVLAALWFLVPPDLRLTVYVLFALNLAGSAGDLVQAATVARVPASALIQDDGSTTRLLLPEADPGGQASEMRSR